MAFDFSTTYDPNTLVLFNGKFKGMLIDDVIVNGNIDYLAWWASTQYKSVTNNKHTKIINGSIKHLYILGQINYNRNIDTFSKVKDTIRPLKWHLSKVHENRKYKEFTYFDGDINTRHKVTAKCLKKFNWANANGGGTITTISDGAHIFTTFTSNDMEIGKIYNISFSVKTFQVYNGVKQTIVNRLTAKETLIFF